MTLFRVSGSKVVRLGSGNQHERHNLFNTLSYSSYLPSITHIANCVVAQIGQRGCVRLRGRQRDKRGFICPFQHEEKMCKYIYLTLVHVQP